MKIIVKVGNKSNIRFSKSKVFRALLAEDLVELSDFNPDCNLAIIEEISSGEEEEVKKFINDFENKDSKNTVLFFIPNEEDEITSGLADELSYNIYMSLKDLYKAIYDKFGINVSIYLDDKKELNSSEMDSALDGIEAFGIFGADEEKEIESAIDEIEKQHEEISTEEISDDSIDNIESISSTDNTDSFADDVKQFIAEEVKEEIDDSASVQTEKVTEEIEETSDNVEEATEEFEETVEEIEETVEEIEETSDNVEVTNEEIERLQLELKDTKYDYTMALKNIKEITERVKELENIVRIVRDEKKVIEDRFNELVDSSDVIEDPISLSEYSILKDNIESAENHIKELESALEKANNTIKSSNEELEEKENSLTELNNKVSELEENVRDLQNSIDSGDAYKDVTDEYNKTVKELRDENQGVKVTLMETSKENDRLTVELEHSASRLESEALYRQKTIVVYKSTIDKIIDLRKELNNKISEIERLTTEVNNLKDSLSDAESKIAEQSDNIESLNNQVSTFDTRTKLMTDYNNTEVDKLKNSISNLESKLKMITEQLDQKNNQYSALVTQLGVDSSGASSLIENNRVLEQTNQTLREKISMLTQQVETLDRNKAALQSQVNNYKNQCQQLNNTVKTLSSMGSASGNMVSNVTLPPIHYNNKAQIIGVFGSGSYGTTTTAMSLAYTLYFSCRVLYIDFDLVTPSADTWFMKSPFKSGTDAIGNCTGLQLFYEHGFQAFQMYFNNYVFKDVDRAKGGSIDYLSGAYYRVDRLKLTTADYTSLFNFLGSMYDYIVVDLGRLGNNDINDQLIKIISDISIKSVAVTTKDKYDIRNFKLKLDDSRIDINKIALILNMCTNSGINNEQNAINSLNLKSKPTLIMEDPNIRQQRKTFNGSNQRSIFNMFVKNLFV